MKRKYIGDNFIGCLAPFYASEDMNDIIQEIDKIIKYLQHFKELGATHVTGDIRQAFKYLTPIEHLYDRIEEEHLKHNRILADLGRELEQIKLEQYKNNNL